MGEIREFGGNRPRQGVAMEIERPEYGRPPERRRDRAGQTVSIELQFSKP